MGRQKGNVGPACLSLRLLGGFSLDRGAGLADGISYEKGRALLAYVAAESSLAHQRRGLAALFWPDLPLNAALANLRLVLLNLRQALDAADFPLLQVERDSVRVVQELLPRIDLARFLSVASEDGSCAVDDERSLARCAEAAALYRGEFLAGISLPECPAFEEWVQVHRETCQRSVLVMLARLAAACERQGAIASALPFASRYIELAPWDEDGHRRLMRLLALNGQPGAALAQYDHCRRILRSELGVAPGEAIRVLAEQIGRGELAKKAHTDEPLRTKPLALPANNELRQVTVLYAELVVGVDADDADEAMSRLMPVFSRWRELVAACGGHVVPTYAGGLLAYFGYPVAREAAVRHALLAALAIAGDGEAGAACRIGVHTGMVVSGGTPPVPDVLGATTATTIRLRLCVAPGEIAVSADTRSLAEGYFDFADAGEQGFPGLQKPIAVSRLMHARPDVGRLEAETQLTPLIGREMELGALLSVWDDVCTGHCHVIQLRGDAGIGKSRLLRAMRERLEGQCVVRELRCHAEFSQTPYHPVIAVFESLLGYTSGDSDEIRFAKLVAYVEAHHPSVADAVISVLAAFLSLPVLPPHLPVNLYAAEQREVVRDMLHRLLDNLAARLPVLLLVEDVQWADPSTLDLISGMLSIPERPPMLVLITSRTGFTPPWPEDHVPTWLLAGLPDGEIGRIISAVFPGIDPVVFRRLVARADGIPLFAEELAKFAAQDKGGTAPGAIPRSLQDLLAARLDATGDAKTTAQLAATIGRAFAQDVLRLVSPQTPQGLLKSLRVLEAAALIESRDGVVHQFRHALFRDAAYLSQGREQRQAAHRHIAEALQGAGTRFVAAHPELLARHFELGGDARQAISCWLAAGNLACQQAANAEALSHFKAGLHLVDQLPDDPTRAHLEFDLLNGVGLAAIALHGYASPEAAEAHARAKRLCEQHAGNRDMFRAVWGLWVGASSRSGYEHAEDLAQQLLRMARGSEDPVQTQQAHFAIGNTLFWQGRFGEAREHLEQAIAMHRPGRHAQHIADFGEDVRITAGAYLAWALDMLGSAAEARQECAEALALARRNRHPFSLAYALTFAALLHCRQRQPEEALLLAAETARLAEHHGFHLWRVGAEVARGWASVQQGCVADVGAIARCIEDIGAVMSGVTLVVLGALADAQALAGQTEAALETIERAMRLGDAIDDRHLDAELLCLRGQCLLALSGDNAAPAAAAYREALAASRLQHAGGLERRAREALLGLAHDGLAVFPAQ